MSNDIQTNDDLENQIGKVGTKLFNNVEDDKEGKASSGLWPDMKVYYAFSPNVGKKCQYTHSSPTMTG